MPTNIYSKLLKVQQEIGAIKKDKKNPYFKSSYFDINSILEAVKPVLNSNGLVLMQALTNVSGRPALTTSLVDAENGEIIQVDPITMPDNPDAQKMGSAITYYRRYALQSLLALEAEDDDGNSAAGNKTPYNSNKQATGGYKKPYPAQKPQPKTDAYKGLQMKQPITQEELAQYS